MNKLSPQVKGIWAINSVLSTVIFLVLVVVAEIFLKSAIRENLGFPFGVLTIVVLIAGIIYSMAFPILNYKYWAFDVRDDELYIERGILTRVKTTAPYRRIQHLDVSQSIFERMMGLATLVVYTAGTRGADLVIPGLVLPYAEALRDSLKNITTEDAV